MGWTVRWTQLFLLIAAIALTGCRGKKPAKQINFNQQLPPGQRALRKISPGEYPDFSIMQTNSADLAKAVDHSLSYLDKPSSRQFFPYDDITHDQAAATLRAMQAILKDAGHQPARWNEQIREKFDVYQSIGAPGPNSGYTGQVLFTGYFTPIVPASPVRTEIFQWPLYKRPADLVSDEATGKVIGRRSADGSIIPGYHTRGEIETARPLAGQELVWLASRWEAYVITIQGSARLRLQNGRAMEIGYAGNNGYDYVSPGLQMVKDGLIAPDQLSLKNMLAYFEQNPAAMDKYLPLNPRYVFFAQRPGGPFGSLNVPVTTMASIATDKEVYPRAMPAFLQVPIPASSSGGTRPFSGFMLDQDTGGAIRAAGRCDIYMGIGPQAGQLAGQQLHPGKLYYIALKPHLIPQYGQPTKVAGR